MADVRELPDQVREFVDMSKEYMRQETLEPAKQLGKFAGFVVGAAVCYALAALFLSVAGVRYMRDVLPEGPYWSVLAYVITAIVLGVIAFVIAKLTNREIPIEDVTSDPFAESTSPEGS